MRNLRKEHYNWKTFDYDCRKIARWAKQIKFKDIYGIPRGGLVVAVRLSHFTDMPIILDYNKISSKTLVVDDICDTGKTLMRLRKLIKVTPTVATLYWQEDSPSPDFWCHKKLKWIIFPWETKPTSRYDKTFA